MENLTTISWIFLATALASKEKPIDLAGISAAADGINHAFPTSKELQASSSWLIENLLVAKVGECFHLTEQGKSVYKETSALGGSLMAMLRRIELRLKDLIVEKLKP